MKEKLTIGNFRLDPLLQGDDKNDFFAKYFFLIRIISLITSEKHKEQFPPQESKERILPEKPDCSIHN
ncbi:hypothetical protein CO165_03765 [Candidatus Roizmanbacteria bacterium CG_4_9_14_3_um_filter_33_18]|uniref:Uncharacterized protein n=2 Tax=Candidatus Roizmaniibacteriota TaxID=1752723 RepID=A0A2M7XXE0_9BACT|nr:MAG: hypothetical protein COW97_03155 [Candidatus Roizmanbacteria bacterium CG22_combo_CG10-13_8_21_14_all_34_12]PJA55406.1 MAG: hypothetical protein CO165_03765 [Candidatus Roizmanbacteria bacterium CG_4_9_14_3_um_filter_33_18]